MNLFERIEKDEFVKSIWNMKYAPNKEVTPEKQIEYMCQEFSNVYTSKELRSFIRYIEGEDVIDPDVMYPHNYFFHAFFNLITDCKFLPGGRVIAGMGLRFVEPERKLTLQNCFALGIQSDSIEGIFDFCKDMAISYAWGGGVGTCISGLRPRNSRVNNASKTSTGAPSFLPLMDSTTATIGQNGRRGAFLAFMYVAHPDILEFITCKKDGKLPNMNISVGITNDFIRALNGKDDYQLWYPDKTEEEEFGENYKNVENIADCYKYPDSSHFFVRSDSTYRTKRVYKTVKAKEVWDLLCTMAWEEGCPGVIFADTIKNTCSYEYTKYKVHAPNPCSELLLPPEGICNLGSINLSRYVTDKKFDFETFRKDVAIATFFLDCVLEYSIQNKMLPFDKQIEIAKNLRILGLGITGWHDCLLQMNMIYGSDEALDFTETIANAFNNEVKQTSEAMGEIFGYYPLYTDEAKHPKRRNAQLMAIAPTGTISLIMGCSTGIEPVYAFKYEKKIRTTNEKGEEIWVPEIIKHPMYAALKDDPNFDKDIWVESQDLNYGTRVKMQSKWQRYIDSAISSTVNMKHEATVKDVSDVYLAAWDQGCKGITIYRDGCARSGVMKKVVETPLEEVKIIDRESTSILSGKTIKIPLEPSWYLTTNFTDQDVPVEVFINAGKSGSDVKASTEAFGRLISLYLQEGGNIYRVIESLKGIHGREPCFKNGWVIQSQPDAIAKALEKILSTVTKVESKLELCPKCQKQTFMAVAGCGNCVNDECLYTNCG